ncbi:hypothetical protein CDD81_3430 [Ophiocordyceps australis]|uniref:Uncharacterized protein n=1 Tax=Ophiocordyceps australis TaxID=1399860 RepID=A0A2C5YCN4_9HYPO|nr:hypothetical protein CDD81_3430 [Ophiocordyceps australis]
MTDTDMMDQVPSVMNLEEYSDVKSICHKMLKRFYRTVATPTEGPCRSRFDQVIFIVCSRKASIRNSTYEAMQHLLGATSMRQYGTRGFCEYIIPWAGRVPAQSNGCLFQETVSLPRTHDSSLQNNGSSSEAGNSSYKTDGSWYQSDSSAYHANDDSSQTTGFWSQAKGPSFQTSRSSSRQACVPRNVPQYLIPGYYGTLDATELAILDDQIANGHEAAVSKGLFNNAQDEMDLWRVFGLHEECPAYAHGDQQDAATFERQGTMMAAPDPSQPMVKNFKIKVLICHTLEDWWWNMFLCLHDDMSTIISTMILPYGLTLSIDGLFLRAPALETLNLCSSCVLLTRNPFEVLSFLGIRQEENIWKERFESPFALYCHLAQCSLFWPDAYAHVEQRLANRNNSYRLSGPERRRWARPAYRQWLQRFMPLCRIKKWYCYQRETRSSVTRRALQRFNASDAYGQACQAQTAFESVQFIRNTMIPAMVPADMDNCRCIRWALECVILKSDYLFPGVSFPSSACPVNGVYDLGRVEEFIKAALPRICELFEEMG